MDNYSLDIPPHQYLFIKYVFKMESNSLDTPRHQKVFTCAINNKVMWRPMQPMLTICGHRGQNPGGVRQPGSDTNISSLSHNFQQCFASHFDAVGCQNYYCQFKYMYILW